MTSSNSGTSTGRFSALMRAAAIGQDHLVSNLLHQGADVNERGPRESTALMFAAAGGHLEIVRTLVESGADLFAKEEGGWDALAHAQADGHEEVADYLAQVLEQ